MKLINKLVLRWIFVGWIVLCLVLMLVIGINLWLNSQNLTPEDIASRAQVVPTDNKLAPTKHEKNPIAIAKNSSANSQNFTPQETKETSQWLNERGYSSPESEVVYKGYSDEILSGLVKNNDLRAIMFVANKLADIDSSKSTDEEVTKNIEMAKNYWRQAAVLGSTVALDHLATYTQKNMDSEEARPKILEMMAIYKVIEMRGDTELSSSSKNHIVNRDHIELTSEEQQLIEQRANAIYTELTEQRLALGLGEFDNSMTAAVKKFLGGPR
jgi:hypothetical protein